MTTNLRLALRKQAAGNPRYGTSASRLHYLIVVSHTVSIIHGIETLVTSSLAL